MNLFRFAGDLFHVLSFVVLLWKLKKSKSVQGLSLKTQEMYFLVFATRYLDLFKLHYFSWLLVYNTTMKLLYLGCSATIVYLFRFKNPWKATYKAHEDTFVHWKFAILPCAVLAVIFNSEFTFMEILWTFSIFLEAVAIMPQLILLQRYRNIENMTADYVACLGIYRGFYIINWIDRYFYEDHYSGMAMIITWISGFVQTALYVDFFYYYAQSKWYGKGLNLPQ